MSRTLNVEIDDKIFQEVENIASKNNKNIAVVGLEILLQAVAKVTKNDFYDRINNVEYCSQEENHEIMEVLKNISSEDLKPARKKVVDFNGKI